MPVLFSWVRHTHTHTHTRTNPLAVMLGQRLAHTVERQRMVALASNALRVTSLEHINKNVESQIGGNCFADFDEVDGVVCDVLCFERKASLGESCEGERRLLISRKTKNHQKNLYLIFFLSHLADIAAHVAVCLVKMFSKIKELLHSL